jgi:hypothetical protein
MLLETHPQFVDGGAVWGDYQLDVPLIRGDHFRASVGFLDGAGESVRFEVVALGGPAGSGRTLETVDDSDDGQLRKIDVDLTPVRGATTLRLLVTALNPAAGRDWAVWVKPRIEGVPS